MSSAGSELRATPGIGELLCSRDTSAMAETPEVEEREEGRGRSALAVIIFYSSVMCATSNGDGVPPSSAQPVHRRSVRKKTW
jgi:hypothetical protein